MTVALSKTTSNSNTAAVTAETALETKQTVLAKIRATWGKFSEQDLSALKGKDDLVTQIVAKYGRERHQAQLDVDAVLGGSRF